MFNIKEEYILLTTLTSRTQKNGHEDIPAASLRCKVSMANKVLDDFSHGLLHSLYEKKEKAQVDLIKNDMFPDLKHENFEPLKLKKEFPDCRVKIHEDINTEDFRFIFPECTLKSFSFEPKTGGTVVVEFTINCVPTGTEFGWLYDNQKRKLLMTIEPAEEQQLEGFEDPVEEVKKPVVKLVEEPAEPVVNNVVNLKERDPLFEMAINFMRKSGKCQIKEIRAHFQIGSQRVSNLIAELEKACWVEHLANGRYSFHELAEAKTETV